MRAPGRHVTTFSSSSYVEQMTAQYVAFVVSSCDTHVVFQKLWGSTLVGVVAHDAFSLGQDTRIRGVSAFPKDLMWSLTCQMCVLGREPRLPHLDIGSGESERVSKCFFINGFVECHHVGVGVPVFFTLRKNSYLLTVVITPVLHFDSVVADVDHHPFTLTVSSVYRERPIMRVTTDVSLCLGRGIACPRGDEVLFCMNRFWGEVLSVKIGTWLFWFLKFEMI